MHVQVKGFLVKGTGGAMSAVGGGGGIFRSRIKEGGGLAVAVGWAPGPGVQGAANTTGLPKAVADWLLLALMQGWSQGTRGKGHP